MNLFRLTSFPVTGTLFWLTVRETGCVISVGITVGGDFCALSGGVGEIATADGTMPSVPPAVVVYPCLVLVYLALARECHLISTVGSYQRRLTYSGRLLALWYVKNQIQIDRILLLASKVA